MVHEGQDDHGQQNLLPAAQRRSRGDRSIAVGPVHHPNASTEHADAPAVRLPQSLDALDRRCLSGAFPTQDPEDFALFDCEGDVLDGHVGAVAFVQMLYFQDCIPCGPVSSRRAHFFSKVESPVFLQTSTCRRSGPGNKLFKRWEAMR